MSYRNASESSFPWCTLGVLGATLSFVRENRETRWVRPVLRGTGLSGGVFCRPIGIEKLYEHIFIARKIKKMRQQHIYTQQAVNVRSRVWFILAMFHVSRYLTQDISLEQENKLKESFRAQTHDISSEVAFIQGLELITLNCCDCPIRI